MDTKKCIEFLENARPSKYTGIKLQNYEIDKINENKIDEIIKRLQIWEAFKKKYGEEYLGYEGGQGIGEVMDDFEQKYFSKRINRIIEVEVEASNMEVIDELAKDIEDMANGQSHRKGKIGVVCTRWVRD